MSVSRPCEQCEKVRRCQMYPDRDKRPVYLCQVCAKALEYTEEYTEQTGG